MRSPVHSIHHPSTTATSGPPCPFPHHSAQAVFVDQAPLQNIAPDWRWGSTGCYDTASLTRLQCKLQSGGWVGVQAGWRVAGWVPQPARLHQVTWPHPA